MRSLGTQEGKSGVRNEANTVLLSKILRVCFF